MNVILKDILKEFNLSNIMGNTDLNITKVSTLSEKDENSLMFANKFKEELIETVNSINNSVILLKEEYREHVTNESSCYIFTSNPRLLFAKVLTYIVHLEEKNVEYEYVNHSYIAKGAVIGKNTLIEPGVLIGSNVTIGENCVIMSGAKIRKNVVIGNNSIIREDAVVGGYGFGMEKDEEGNNFRIPHIGGVRIGNNVEVGALTTVCSGTIKPTILEDYAKIDDHVHIAHNCIIRKNAMVIACAEVSGSVEVGENAWIAPNSSIINGIKIGKNCVIGMGAIVNKSVEDNLVMVGHQSETLDEAKAFKKLKKKLISQNTLEE